MIIKMILIHFEVLQETRPPKKLVMYSVFWWMGWIFARKQRNCQREMEPFLVTVAGIICLPFNRLRLLVPLHLIKIIQYFVLFCILYCSYILYFLHKHIEKTLFFSRRGLYCHIVNFSYGSIIFIYLINLFMFSTTWSNKFANLAFSDIHEMRIAILWWAPCICKRGKHRFMM